MDERVSYLSPHVFCLLCDIPNNSDRRTWITKQCCGCSFNITDFCTHTYRDGDTKTSTTKQLYVCNMRHLLQSAERRNFLGEQWCNKKKLGALVSSIEWTGSSSVIVNCLLDSSSFAMLSLLKLTVITERALGDVFSSVAIKKCPSLLRDLLNTNCLLEVFGKAPIAVLQTIMGSPVSLNLRNVLWHGFPMLGEIQEKFCYILVELIASLGEILKKNKLINIGNRKKLKMPNMTLVWKTFPVMKNEKDLILKVFKSTSFIPPGMLPAWKMSLELFFSERYSDAVILFLPQLEHALRCLFVVVNDCPGRLLTAESDVLFTTFDEILAENVGKEERNKLLKEIGPNLTEMLFDLLFFPEGPRLRDHLSHGEYDFAVIGRAVANYLICIGLCFCLKYLLPWRQGLKIRSQFLCSLCFVMDGYRSVFHPISLLNREIISALDNVEIVDKIIKRMNIQLNSDKYNTIRTEVISTANLYISSPFVRGIFEKDCEISFENDIVQRYIGKIINKHREILHLPKKELEIIGLLRQVTKHCTNAINQVIIFTNQKAKQLENRTLRSRARENFTALVSVFPVLLSFWLTMLLIISVESLISARHKLDNNWEAQIRYLKKCLKYAENVSSLCSPSNNKWLECLKVVSRFVELTKGRVKNDQKVV